MTGPELQMPTSVGSAALESAVARKSAPIVEMVSSRDKLSLTCSYDKMLMSLKLVKAGAIVIGKANLSVRKRFHCFWP